MQGLELEKSEIVSATNSVREKLNRRNNSWSLAKELDSISYIRSHDCRLWRAFRNKPWQRTTKS